MHRTRNPPPTDSRYPTSADVLNQYMTTTRTTREIARNVANATQGARVCPLHVSCTCVATPSSRSAALDVFTNGKDPAIGTAPHNGTGSQQGASCARHGWRISSSGNVIDDRNPAAPCTCHAAGSHGSYRASYTPTERGAALIRQAALQTVSADVTAMVATDLDGPIVTDLGSARDAGKVESRDRVFKASILADARARVSGATDAQAKACADGVDKAWRNHGGRDGARGNRRIGRLQPRLGSLSAAERKRVGGGPLDDHCAAGSRGKRRKADMQQTVTHATDHALRLVDDLPKSRREKTSLLKQIQWFDAQATSNRKRKKHSRARAIVERRLYDLRHVIL